MLDSSNLRLISKPRFVMPFDVLRFSGFVFFVLKRVTCVARA